LRHHRLLVKEVLLLP